MEEAARSLLKEFQKQKVSKESAVLQTAQRLVNQFRALDYLPPSFLQEFNVQLLACSPNVRRFFSTIMGGSEVLNYLEFLEKKIPQTEKSEKGENSAQSDIVVDGYLPSPESDLMVSDSDDTISVSKQQWDEMKTQQKDLLEQTQRLMRQMKIQQQGGISTQYSEILDDEI